MKFARLRKLTKQMIARAESAQEEVEQMRDTWDDRSERWQESEKGIQADDDINELEDLVAAVDCELQCLDVKLKELGSG